MDDDSVAAVALGLLEGGGGGFEEKSGIGKGRRGAGYADRDCDRVEAGLVLDLQTLYAFSNLLGTLKGVSCEASGRMTTNSSPHGAQDSIAGRGHVKAR